MAGDTVRLFPSDSFYDLASTEAIGRERVPLVHACIETAGLTDAFLTAFRPPGASIGDYALQLPSGFRVLHNDESDRLLSVRQAAVRDMRRQQQLFHGGKITEEEATAEERDDTSGARLLVVRGSLPHAAEQFDEPELTLRTGEIVPIRLNSDERNPRRFWGVLEVSTFGWSAPGGQFSFEYRLVHAVPDTGPLRVSNVTDSIARSLCFDLTTRFFLSTLDLSKEPLPDPDAAISFLIRSHEAGFPGFVPPKWHEDGNTQRSFSERLMAAMGSDSSGLRPEPPRPRLIKDFTQAEVYAAEFMRYLGFEDATPTPVGVDGGVDVVAAEAIAQVKMEGIPTGRPVIQAIFGVSSLAQQRALVFSLAGYTTQAIEWAEAARVACFEFALDGSILAVSESARELLPSWTGER